MSERRLITSDELKEKLRFDPETGIFCWINGSRNGIKAGSPAGAKVTVGGGKIYIQIGLDGRKYYAHRLAWLYVTGDFPTLKVEHINGDGADNRWVNLSHVSAFENQHGTRRVPLGKNKYPGVYSVGKRFSAAIKVRGKRRYLGAFASPEIAYSAYLEAKRSLLG